MQPIRWGILGTGAIAQKFAAGLAELGDAELAAVGSRSAAGAAEFAAAHGGPRAHGSYAALAADPAVDVVYIATPHSLHHEHALLCLAAGKAVLCEKPFTINAREAAAVIAAAQRSQRFLMEAMWTRFLPAHVRCRALVDSGALGELRLVQADFGFHAAFDPASRLFDPALGGGALLDVGVYPVALAQQLLGPPTAVAALGELTSTGVDGQTAILLQHAGGALAQLSAAITTTTPHEAWLLGTAGRLQLHAPWWRAERLTLYVGDTAQTEELPLIGNGYQYEAAEVMRCLRAGLLESPALPLAATLATMQTLDAVRAQLGVVYPADRASEE